jgi:hypothetical protein
VRPFAESSRAPLVVPTNNLFALSSAIAVIVPVVLGEVYTTAPAEEYFTTLLANATYTFPDVSIAVSATVAVGAPLVCTAEFQDVSLPPAVFALAGEICELTV